MIRTIEWTDAGVTMLDQRLLPAQEVYNTYADYRDVAEAIRSMVIRGAPAIGVAAAMGIALGAKKSPARSVEILDPEFTKICDVMGGTRPTAVNLFWAVERMKKVYARTKAGGVEAAREALIREAGRMHEEDIQANRTMGRLGQDLIPAGGRILTHCNASALATAGYGTALGVIRAAHAQGKVALVWVDETRPVMQGSRLTAWECVREAIPATLITDGMAGHFLRSGDIACVVV